MLGETVITLAHFVLHCASILRLCSQPYLLATRLLVPLLSPWQQSAASAWLPSIMLQSGRKRCGGGGSKPAGHFCDESGRPPPKNEKKSGETGMENVTKILLTRSSVQFLLKLKHRIENQQMTRPISIDTPHFFRHRYAPICPGVWGLT